MLLSITGLDFLSAISGAATSISNVGPGLGEMIGPNGNYKEISWYYQNGFYQWACLMGRLGTICSFGLIFSIFLEKLKLN